MNEGGRVTEMSGYFDMHCHLLYGVDDGAETMEAALELLGLQYEDGVRTVCLTPHCRRELFEWSTETVQRHFELLKERAGTVYPDLKLILGCEIHVSHDLVQQLREGRCLTMGGSDHILLEFPEYADKKYLIDRCHEVIRSGYSPVLAHAERCTAIRKDIGLLQRLVDMGVQIQMNAGSILGEEGLAWKWFCKKAMKHGLLHYIGSDAHDMVHRRPNLGKCAAYVERIMGKEYRDTIMMVNPQRITEGSAWEDYE